MELVLAMSGVTTTLPSAAGMQPCASPRYLGCSCSLLTTGCGLQEQTGSGGGERPAEQ